MIFRTLLHEKKLLHNRLTSIILAGHIRFPQMLVFAIMVSLLQTGFLWSGFVCHALNWNKCRQIQESSFTEKHRMSYEKPLTGAVRSHYTFSETKLAQLEQKHCSVFAITYYWAFFNTTTHSLCCEVCSSVASCTACDTASENVMWHLHLFVFSAVMSYCSLQPDVLRPFQGCLRKFAETFRKWWSDVCFIEL